MSAGQFDSFRASVLYCPRCGSTMAVREKLLLVLPHKELYDYLCVGCGDSVGTREVTATDRLLKETLAAGRTRRAQVRIL